LKGKASRALLLTTGDAAMNDYLEIFSNVVLIATLQPRSRERYYPPQRTDEIGLGRSRLFKTTRRRFEIPERT
jgi:hypothetical protein